MQFLGSNQWAAQLFLGELAAAANIFFHPQLHKECEFFKTHWFSWGHAAAQQSRSICIVYAVFCYRLIHMCIQIFTDAPESCPLSPAAPVLCAPTRQSKKMSRQNRPLAVYNPQALDIQNGKRCTSLYLYIFTFLGVLNERCCECV